ncbi:MAG: hypothetical protein ACE5HD_09055 [Acidobacteriota bacterium]
MRISTARVKGILTRASGFLRPVCSHSLQPYRGCSFGRALCGAGCYVQHNPWLNPEGAWGRFLEARVNAPQVYRATYHRERAWARSRRGGFSIFMSSSTDPFVPQERRFRITRRLLQTMTARPPDVLILQTHTHRVLWDLDLCRRLAGCCDLRVHISIESDRNRLPGLPPPASSVERRLEAAGRLKRAGVRVVATVAPLLPIQRPDDFFRRIRACADAVVLDHFVGGDGSRHGERTLRTALPRSMARIDPESVGLAYLERMVKVAREIMPGRVGVGAEGFAGRFPAAEPPGRVTERGSPSGPSSPGTAGGTPRRGRTPRQA